VILPFMIVSDYQKYILIMAGFASFWYRLNLLMVMSERLLGHIAFFGIGAYTSALLFLEMD
jgi:ABC-type branched-subunit amino acid transport system permease subunit